MACALRVCVCVCCADCVYYCCMLIYTLFKTNVWCVLVFKMNMARTRYDATIYNTNAYIYKYKAHHKSGDGQMQRKREREKESPRVLNPSIYQNIHHTRLFTF